MVVLVTAPPRSLTLRRYRPADQDAVLHLIAVDRLPGQPRTSPAMLGEALAGRSPVDAGWWEELPRPTTDVALDPSRAVVGVISYARRARDHAGLILWMHCAENTEAAAALIEHASAALGPRPLEAFQFASALSLGLEALPATHRPVTDRALRGAGFTAHRLWRYMRAELPLPGLPQLDRYEISPAPEGHRIEVRRDGRTVADALIGTPIQGTGVLWWIGVEQAERGKGLGRALLGTALQELTDRGATETVLYVDDDAPQGDPRDRSAATALYTAAGFEEIDNLYSYSRRP